ncbi:MAG: GntR family transcriptional regulator [Prevotellaceae bacterium]|jgi:predicted RNA-binding protein (virulence factor B family)|nr:GntR family transcriptional regulator [Prevotellaceae bacterium]
MKIELGKFNTLRVTKEVEFGLYLDGGDEGEVLLPKRYVPEDARIGDELPVFLYLDNEERLTATTQTPLAQVGDFACLEAAWVNQYGAFLHWGPMKDLFVPFAEQKLKMEVGKKYIVHVHLDDESYRIVASAKVERYLSRETPPYCPDEKVQILVQQKTDLGFKAIVDNQYGGLLYENQLFQPLHTGDRLTAYIKQVREDGKIDLMLQPQGVKRFADFAHTLLHYLQAHDGHTPLNDKSPAEEIYAAFGVSKKTFKQGVGDLYKKRLIRLDGEGIWLVGANKHSNH